LDAGLSLKFLHRFEGSIWNLVAGEEGVLAIEVRTTEPKQVSFSALNVCSNEFLWKDRVLEENWWVNASAICGGMIVFTVYMDTNNPDKKGIVVYSLKDLKLQWWKNDFSINEAWPEYLRGFTSKLGLKEITLDVVSGSEINVINSKIARPLGLLKPFQYPEGLTHFDIVQKFLADRLNFNAVSSLEYLEAEGRIIISAYTPENEGLANYLFVLSAEGKVLLKEKLDGPLKGIGLDTFFILQGCLIFVKNKVELISYTII
jgi:hypothetical protein